MKRMVIPFVVAVAALAGCSHPSTGTVIGKHYEPRRTYTSCTLVGKVTVCSPRVDDEDWVITLRNEETEWDEEVSQQYYETVKNGDRWVRSN